MPSEIASNVITIGNKARSPLNYSYKVMLCVKDSDIPVLERYLAEVARHHGHVSQDLETEKKGLPPVAIGVLTFLTAAAITTAVVLPLELTGTTAVSTSSWMMQDIVAQDAILAVASIAILAVLAVISGKVAERSR